MKAFTFVRPDTIEAAAKASAEKGSVIKAGGIDLLDRMKERVDEPDRVVWLGEIPNSRAIQEAGNAGKNGQHSGPPSYLVIGAGAVLADVATSKFLRWFAPALAEAAGSAASPQVRAMATIGGNLCQHTRCGYYRHRSFPCVKRGDAVCPVLDDGAVQETAGIFGNRPCASAHPSSLAPVLCALDASILIVAPAGSSKVPVRSCFQTPQRGVAADVTLPSGGVIESIMVMTEARSSAYEEIRQKAAFDWALASCCVRLSTSEGKVTSADIWLGAVAPTPWHAEAAEKALVGKPLSDETIAAAAEAAVAGATPLPGNAYKLDLVKVVVRRALERLRSS